MTEKRKGKHWFNNGQEEKAAFECPEGWNPGRLPISEETRRKHSDNNGMKHLTEEQKKKHSDNLKAFHATETLEHKKHKSEAISKAKKGKHLGRTPWNKGKKGVITAWNKGKHLSEEQKAQISETKKNKSEEEKLRISKLISETHKGKSTWNKGLKTSEWSGERKQPAAGELLEKCLSIDFPQTRLNEASIKRNYNYLQFTDNISKHSNTCIQLIQHFHPSLWQANRKGYVSPYVAWSDASLLEKTISNRLKYKGSDLSPKDIRAGLTIGKIAPKVSVFRPSMAKYILETYAKDSTEIFDPCSGYSGRLLAAAALNKKYIGQDINSVTVAESKNLIASLHLKNCDVRCCNSLNTTGSYECLFTCSPYADLENWNQYIEDLTCDEWIDICLENYNCKRYIFVVNATSKYKNNVVEEICNKAYFSNSKEYIILIEK